MKKDPLYFMNRAFKQAQIAFSKGEVPVGALIVDKDGAILARAHNKIEKNNCQSAHAELLAIQKASKKVGWRLNQCSIYVTLEPCLMCYGLIRLCRIEQIYYAAPSPLFGYKGHSAQTKDPKDEFFYETMHLSAYAREINVYSGLKENASIAILRSFFKKARQRGRDGDETAEGITRQN